MHSAAAQPVEPLSYRDAGVAPTSPPMALAVVAVLALAVAVATFALCAWALTHAYYTSAPMPLYAPYISSTPAHAQTIPRRVTVAEGDAIINGIGQLIPLSDNNKLMIQQVLVKAEDKVVIELPSDQTPAKIAALRREAGELFGESGYFAVIGDVRIEVTDRRVKITGQTGEWPMIENRGGGSVGYNIGSRPQYWTFAPPPPQPALPPPPPPPPPTLEQQLRHLAPHLTSWTDGIVSALLAILLLIASIGLLNYSRRGRTLTLVWAWIKLPLALGAIAGYFWLQMDGSITLPRGVTPWTKFILQYPEFVTSILAAVFAIAVLLTLNLPQVRRYFRQIPSKSL